MYWAVSTSAYIWLLAGTDLALSDKAGAVKANSFLDAL